VADFRFDQAAGLRRMLGGAGKLQVITFVAGCEGVGRSVAVANLGVALARLGKEVLIIDEHSSSDDIAASFGMSSRYDLLNVVQRELALKEVLLRPMNGLSILPAAKAAKKIGCLSIAQQQSLLDSVVDMEQPIDIILVDASMAHPNGFSPFGLASQEAVVVLSGNSASITEAYSLIKKVSATFSRKRFRILVNKVRTQADGRSIYENIAQVATHRGIAQLDFAGAIPMDDLLRQSSQLCRSVLVQAPDSPSAQSFREIATDLLYWEKSDREAGGVEHFMQQLLHLSQRITPKILRA
jgi:flagellar biosynthesis protein FlhG